MVEKNPRTVVTSEDGMEIGKECEELSGMLVMFCILIRVCCRVCIYQNSEDVHLIFGH